LLSVVNKVNILLGKLGDLLGLLGDLESACSSVKGAQINLNWLIGLGVVVGDDIRAFFGENIWLGYKSWLRRRCLLRIDYVIKAGLDFF